MAITEKQFPHLAKQQSDKAAAAAAATPAADPTPVPAAPADPAAGPTPTPVPAAAAGTAPVVPAQPSADPAADPKPAEPNAFDDFYGDAEVSALKDLPAGARAYLAKSLGLAEDADPNKLGETLSERLQRGADLEKASTVPVYANEDIAQLNELAKSGQNWRAHLDSDAQIKHGEATVKQWEATDATEWLKWDLGNQAARMGTDKAEFIERNMRELNETQIQQLGNKLRVDNIALKNQEITGLRTEAARQIEASKTAQAAWNDGVVKASKEYKDDHVGNLRTSEASSIAKTLGSDMVSVRLPKKFFDEVLAGQGGNLDPEKAVKVLAELRLGPKKIKHLWGQERSTTRKAEFLKQANADPNQPGNPAAVNTDAEVISVAKAYQNSIRDRNAKSRGKTAKTA